MGLNGLATLSKIGLACFKICFFRAESIDVCKNFRHPFGQLVARLCHLLRQLCKRIGNGSIGGVGKGRPALQFGAGGGKSIGSLLPERVGLLKLRARCRLLAPQGLQPLLDCLGVTD